MFNQPKLNWQLDLGATLLMDESLRFRVWAPRVREVSVILPHRGDNPVPLTAEENGYFSGVVAAIACRCSLWARNMGNRHPSPILSVMATRSWWRQ